MNTKPTVVMIPGMGGSGPEHWQTLWEKEHPEYHRVEQRDWDEPVLIEWIVKLEDDLNSIAGRKVLVAHSLGCIIAVEGCAHRDDIAGALLVAPVDLEALETPGETPLTELSFSSIVVASENDPWADISRAKEFADHWGSEFINLGKAGHINADSNLGEWTKGKLLLNRFMQG